MAARQAHGMIRHFSPCLHIGKLFTLALVLALLPGCASKQAYVCARTNPRHHPDSNNTYAIASHSKPRPDDESLRRFLEAELRMRGFRIVSQAEADYTFAFWFDDTWLPAKRVVYGEDGSFFAPSPTMDQPYTQNLPYGGGIIYRESPWRDLSKSQPHVVDDPYPVRGIRLKLYPGGNATTNHLQTIWDGYIDAGAKLPSRLQPVLIQHLLDYFGKEFTGKIRLTTD